MLTIYNCIDYLYNKLHFYLLYFIKDYMCLERIFFDTHI